MKIGIEAQRANLENPTGVEHYAKQLILALSKIDTQNEYILYLQTKPAEWMLTLPKNFSYKIIPFPIFWTQLRISWEMLWHPVDALFIMASALPIIHPRNSVVTIHDIAWDFYPETFSPFMLNYLRFSTWFACRFARNIIAVSEQTKKDLLRKYNLPPEKVHVVHHGFDLEQEISQPKANEKELEEEKKRIAALPEKFIIFIGTLQPRKNIIGLIDAFIYLKKKSQQAGKPFTHCLVIAGGKGWLYDQIMNKIENYPEVVYFGYVHDRFALLKKAGLLVLPSFYEGFGMTILDAFAMKIPLAAANISSMPEVAREGAEYFDPDNTESIASAINRVLSDSNRRGELVALGTIRLSNFSWEKCAMETLQVIS